MDYLIASLTTLIGLTLLAYAGDKLVAGASALAQRLKVSDVFIGIVIIGFGTSLPEVVATGSAAFHGQNDIALGNIVGSNIANVGLILGIALLIARSTVDLMPNRKDYLFMMTSLLLLTLLLVGIGQLTFIAGLFLLFCLVGYLYLSLKTSSAGFTHSNTPLLSSGFMALFIVGGLIGLVVGAQLLIQGATTLAHLFGVPERIIGITLVALGTSLPELSATIAAARKSNLNLTVGNILGSNAFNVMAAGGIASLFTPLHFAGFGHDLIVMLLFSIAIFPLFFWKKSLPYRGLGLFLFTTYLAYTAYLFMLTEG